MNIGFMQGRLCDRVDGLIQAFPWQNWQKEFPAAQRLGLQLMEWTLDQHRLYENPLMTDDGRDQILQLSTKYGVRVFSLTGDCFMQAPFFKASGDSRDELLSDLYAVVEASEKAGIRYVLIPLVDNGSVSSPEQEASLIAGLMPLRSRLVANGMKIVFESDFSARDLAKFIANFPDEAFGINYDIGNSAALGYDAEEEIKCYGHRIANVHIKDRLLHGTTVPLGRGNANFPAVFSALNKLGYSGNFILQTARADDNDHEGVLASYRDMSIAWWVGNGS